MKNTTQAFRMVTLAALLVLASYQTAPADSGKEAKNKVTYEKIGKVLKAQKININTADILTLANLKGIGPEHAQNIIDYRNKNGKFKSIVELTKIKGIDDELFAQIAPLVTVKQD